MVCFWKFCKAFEGPHSASAMPVDQNKLLGVQKRKDKGYEGNKDEDKLREAEVHRLTFVEADAKAR